MKKHINPVIALISCLALALASCGKSDAAGSLPTNGQGMLQLSFDIPGYGGQSKAAEYDALAISTLRLYKVEPDGQGGATESLIRKYKPATDVPANLYLAAGKYKVTIEAGDNSEASFTHKSYAGTSEFDLAAHETKIVPVVCKITNIVVRAVFDATITQKFDKSRRLYVCASDEFSRTDAENNLVPTLEYTEDTVGYFLLPEGTQNLSWGFFGESSDPEIDKNGTKTGKIQLPQQGMQYTLTLKYSKTPDGYLTVNVKVREYESAHDDSFTFSPQPTLTGDGFPIGNVTGYYLDPVKFKIASINPLSSLKMTAGGQQYDVVAGGAAVDGIAAEGIAFKKIDEYNSSLSLDGTFFAKLTSGVNELSFLMTDTDNSEGKATARVAVAGATGASSTDLWFGTANLNAIVTNPSGTDIKIRYRIAGTDAWTELNASKGADGYTYTAQATDFKAGRTYECQLLENGAENGAVRSVNTEAGIQLPNAGFEEWQKSGKAWYPYASGGTEFWGTGNPGATSLGDKFNLTTGEADPRPGSSGTTCAKLQTQFPNMAGIGKLAAGNIFVGSFGAVSGMGGTVNMGRPFTFNAKPTGLRVWYKCNVGSGDKGRIFVCLIRMTKAGATCHVVNTNDADETAFSPSDEFLYTQKSDASTLEGHILGYGDLMIESSVAQWTEVTIPINYREQYNSEKPNVLMVTASASYRGDYFEGSTDSNLFLDDVEFIY